MAADSPPPDKLSIVVYAGTYDKVHYALVMAAAVYTSWGGLKSVVMTDALQGVIMFIGMGVIFVAVWNAAGGWSSWWPAMRIGRGS